VNKWLKQQANLIMDAGLAYEALTLTTQDHKEALKAMQEKRKPNFIRSRAKAS
jgi:enoyl-CoA hydratase